MDPYIGPDSKYLLIQRSHLITWLHSLPLALHAQNKEPSYGAENPHSHPEDALQPQTPSCMSESEDTLSQEGFVKDPKSSFGGYLLIRRDRATDQSAT